ncbi:MAG: hypothetical protein IPN34_16005 [Planctomycetes bacterium]|nr:hypothetical protein [Planctomycetota bacterium]
MRTASLALTALAILAATLAVAWIAMVEDDAALGASVEIASEHQASQSSGASSSLTDRRAASTESDEEQDLDESVSAIGITPGALSDARPNDVAEAEELTGESFTLRVIDDEGRLLPGEPVCLVWTSRSRAWAGIPWHGVTDDAGRVRIGRGSWWRGFGEILATVHRPLFDEPVLALPNNEVWPSGDFELSVPRPARWHARVVDENGKPILSERLLHLVRPADAGVHVPWLQPALVQRESGAQSEPLVVPPGRRLRIHAEDATDERFPGPELELPPLAAGEAREVELRFGETKPWVSVRLLDEEGAPFAAAQVLVWCGRIADTWNTDDAGRLRLRIDQALSPSGPRTLRILGYADRSYFPPRGEAWNQEHQDLAVEIDLSYELASGEHELGTHTLRRPPPLLEGRVVDDRGEAVPFASVDVRHEVEVDARGAPAGTLELEFVALTMLDADARGRFALRGKTEARRFRLQAQRAELLEVEFREVARGDRDVELRLQRPARLTGIVALPLRADGPGAIVHLVIPPPPPRSTEVSPSSEGDEAFEPTYENYAPIRDGGGFDFGPLPAGRARLRLLSMPDRNVLAEFDVELQPGERCQDPRLSPLVPR